MSSQINQKLVAKNTLMLYIRMGVMMVVTLYTSRVVLATLGVDDFGIYNVVGSIIVMFSFMNTTLTITIRRFLAYELGSNNLNSISKVFNASIIAVFITSIIMVLCLEILGGWFLNNKLNIPIDRLPAANIVFQLTIFSFFINLNVIPFSSAIVTYEKMSIFAYIGITESLLKLSLVLSLAYLSADKLILYGLLVLSVSIFVAFLNFLYCILKVIPIRNLSTFERKDVLSIFSFSAWSIMGTIIYMFATQGLNMIFNIFYGVAINAALGVSHQVSNAIKQFVDGFQTAFNPQLTKNYSAEKLGNKTFEFVCQTSRMTILLVSVFSVPIIANINPLLSLWLESVPNYAVPFSVIFIIYTAIDGSSSPLFMLVYAKGDVKLYQIVVSIIQLFYIALIYILCDSGNNPIFVLSMTIVSSLIIYIARLIILRNIMNFPIMKFLRAVIVPFILPLLLLGGEVYINYAFGVDNIIEVVISLIFLFVVTVLICWGLYMNNKERSFILSFIIKKNTR